MFQQGARDSVSVGHRLSLILLFSEVLRSVAVAALLVHSSSLMSIPGAFVVISVIRILSSSEPEVAGIVHFVSNSCHR